MAVTISANNYPANTTGTGISGKREVLYVCYGENPGENGPFVLVGGLINHSISYSSDVSTAQTKSSGYWAEGTIVAKSATLDASLMVKRGDLGQQIIDEFVMNDAITSAKGALLFCIVDLDAQEYTQMWACPSSWEHTADAEDFIQQSLSATITGKPERKTNFAGV